MSGSDDDEGPPVVRAGTGVFTHLSPRIGCYDSGQVSPMAFGDRGQSFRLLASNSFALQRVSSMGALDGSMTVASLSSSGAPRDIVRHACNNLKHHIAELGIDTVIDEGISVHIRQGPRIGSGGYANVYSGINTITGELVAIKELAVGASSPQQFDDVAAEFNLLRKLRHPNVIRYILFEHSLSQQVCRIVMELMAGGSALQLLQNYGPLAESVLRGYVTQILAGLDFIHRHGITHRDIKPANILVHSSGVVKLADFGCSKLIHARTSATRDLLGTPVYMAPEFIKGRLHQKSDVWAIGCTMLELATGRRPWQEAGLTEHLPLMFHISTVGTGPDIPSTLSEGLRDFLNQCFTIDLEDRPSAAQLLTHSWLMEGDDDDDMAQELIESIGARQTSSLVDSLILPPSLAASASVTSMMSSPVGLQDAPQALLIRRDPAGTSDEGQCLSITFSPTAVAAPPSLQPMGVGGASITAHPDSPCEGDNPLTNTGGPIPAIVASSPDTTLSPVDSLSALGGDGGPVHVRFPVAARGRRVTIDLDVQPSDVSVKLVDRKPSFVLSLSEDVRNQLTSAMNRIADESVSAEEEDDVLSTSLPRAAGDTTQPRRSTKHDDDDVDDVKLPTSASIASPTMIALDDTELLSSGSSHHPPLRSPELEATQKSGELLPGDPLSLGEPTTPIG